MSRDVGFGTDEPVWAALTFSSNRDRLLEGDVAARFLATLMARPRVRRLHFSVNGTMIQAWSPIKSVKPIDPGQGSGQGFDDEPPPSSGGRNLEADFYGETRTKGTHASTTDPEAKLYRKSAGTEARLAFHGHALMENRCGLDVDACLTQADGHAERLAALAMIEKHADRPPAITLDADKGGACPPGLDPGIRPDFVNELRSMNVRPHVA